MRKVLVLLVLISSPLWGRGPQGARDAFGYRVEDSTSGYCGYQWVNATASPLAFVAPYALPGDPAANDDGGAVVVLALPFEFYGISYPSLVVSPNGYLAFAGALEQEDGRDFSNDPVAAVPTYELASGSPRFGFPGRFLVFHDDLEVPSQGKVVAQFFSVCPRVSESLGAEPCTVVSWQAVRRVGDAGALNFQALLYHSSGELVAQFASTDASQGGSATVGIQDHWGRVGLGYAFNTPGGVLPNTGVCFFSPRFPPGGPTADLDLSLELANDPPESGSFEVPIRLGNFGPSPAESTVVRMNLPPGVAYVQDTCGGWPGGQWQVGLLPEKAGVTCTLTLANNGGGNVTFIASSAAADPEPANNLTTLAVPIADDGDGVLRQIEDSFPGGDGFPPFAKGDGNGDGIPDSQQAHVATLPLASGKGYLTVEVSSCGQLREVTTLLEASQPHQDPQFDYPLGLVSFSLPCSQASVKLLFHALRTIPPVYRTAGGTLQSLWMHMPGAVRTRERGIFGFRFSLAENKPGDGGGSPGIQHLGGPAQAAATPGGR